MKLQVTSEIGKLRSVLVHLPGREIDLMVPPMMAQLLFDDILYGQVAREEHRRFQQLIRFVADRVYDMQDLLEDILEDDDLKDVLIRDLTKRLGLTRRFSAKLRELRPTQLAETLVGGVLSERETSGELPRFDLNPVPNYFFMRDPQIVIGDGVVISSMATAARRREALLSRYVFMHHKEFAGRDLLWMDFMSNGQRERAVRRSTPTIEGGDVLVARHDLLIVGVSERTSRAGVETLARALQKSGSGIRWMIIVELPRQRSFMHLDTVFTIINHRECLIYPPVILPGGSQAATVTQIDLSKKKDFAYVEQKSLLAALKRRGLEFEPIYCGGQRAVDQQREQWTDGANAFALAPGIILLYERNVRTAEVLASNGYHIVYEDDLLLGRSELELWTKKKYAIQIQGHELSRARGGPRCMTMPLERDEI